MSPLFILTITKATDWIQTLKDSDLSRLNNLHILGNRRSTTEPQLLGQFIKSGSLSTLHSLWIDSTHLGSHGGIALALGINRLHSLEYLTLYRTGVDCYTATAIAGALYNLPVLRYLGLGGNDISDNGAIAISLALPYSNLQGLSLINNRINRHGISALLKNAALTESLTEMDVEKNEMFEADSECRSVLSQLNQKPYFNLICDIFSMDDHKKLDPRNPGFRLNDSNVEIFLQVERLFVKLHDIACITFDILHRDNGLPVEIYLMILRKLDCSRIISSLAMDRFVLWRLENRTASLPLKYDYEKHIDLFKFVVGICKTSLWDQEGLKVYYENQ